MAKEALVTVLHMQRLNTYIGVCGPNGGVSRPERFFHRFLAQYRHAMLRFGIGLREMYG